jgi:hypothetical protein
VSAAAAGVVRLDAARARSLTRELARALDVAVELVRELWQGEAWRALGHDSWEAYCAAELPQLAVIVRGMPREERDAKVSELRETMSLRAVSAVTGLAPNTVRAASAGVVVEKTRGRDGVLRPATSTRTPAPRVPTTVRVLAVVVGAGPDGLTVREVCKAARLPREVVGPALCRLSQTGRLSYVRPQRRGLFGRYVSRVDGAAGGDA